MRWYQALLRTRALPWAVLAAIGTAACGGSGGGMASPAGGLSCTAGASYLGAPLHPPLPATAFPAPGRPESPAALPAGLSALLDARLAELRVQTDAPALAAAVDVPGLGRWQSTQGLARVAPPAPADSLTPFYWGSVAKALTAVLVLQLVDEGRLRLDDRLARWFPQMPQAGLITIEQLLNHTSGLATNAQPPAGAAPAGTVADALRDAAATPSALCPGTGHSYSNTGYFLLGLIVEALDGQPFHRSLQQRIAAPLGLATLRALKPGEEPVAGLATPHLGRTPTTDAGAWLRIGAGNMVGTPAEMAAVWKAVLTGRLLRPDTVRSQWARLFPMSDASAPASPGAPQSWYGLGVTLVEWTDAQGRLQQRLGHVGGIPAANATVHYDPATAAFVAVAVNSEQSSAAVANALLVSLAAWQATPAGLASPTRPASSTRPPCSQSIPRATCG